MSREEETPYADDDNGDRADDGEGERNEWDGCEDEDEEGVEERGRAEAGLEEAPT